MTETIEDLKRKIKELTLQAEELAISETFAGEFALLLHKYQCKLNHTDGCSFMYEEGPGKNKWEGRGHKQYLAQATKILTEAGLITGDEKR